MGLNWISFFAHLSNRLRHVQPWSQQLDIIAAAKSQIWTENRRRSAGHVTSPKTHRPPAKKALSEGRPHAKIPSRDDTFYSPAHPRFFRQPTRAILPPWLPSRVCNASARRRRVSFFYCCCCVVWYGVMWCGVVLCYCAVDLIFEGWLTGLFYSYCCRPLQGMRIVYYR